MWGGVLKVPLGMVNQRQRNQELSEHAFNKHVVLYIRARTSMSCRSSTTWLGHNSFVRWATIICMSFCRSVSKRVKKSRTSIRLHCKTLQDLYGWGMHILCVRWGAICVHLERNTTEIKEVNMWAINMLHCKPCRTYISWVGHKLLCAMVWREHLVWEQLGIE